MGSLTLLILVISFIVACIIYVCRLYNNRPKNFPPGPPRLPIWGSYWFLLKENYTFMETALYKLGKKYNTDILGFYMGDVPSIITLSNALCKEVLTREEFEGRNDTIVSRGRCYGEILGLFFLEGEQWKEQRRFSLRHLRDFGYGRRSNTTEQFFEREMQDVLTLLQCDPKPEDSDICRKKGVVLMPQILYAPILNTVLQILVGQRFDDQKMLRYIAMQVYKFVKTGDSTGNALCATPWLRYIAPKYFKYNDIMETSDCFVTFMKGLIDEHKENFSNDHHVGFLDVYLSKLRESDALKNSNEGFTEDQLLWTLIDYMFPAATSTTHTVNYMFVYLVNDFTLQTKIQEELDRIVGRSRMPTLDDRKNMPYTEAFIRESLRKDTITPLGVPRKCLKDTTVAGYFIPKGAMVVAHLGCANNDPNVYDSPNEFRPERFLDADGKLLKKDYSLPFGAGKRLCVGETFARQLWFLILTTLMQNFTFKAVGELPNPNNKVGGLVVNAPDFWIEAVPR